MKLKHQMHLRSGGSVNGGRTQPFSYTLVMAVPVTVWAIAACCLLSPSMMQENAANVAQLWSRACGAPGSEKASKI
jgi:hypothetical protein